MIWVAIICFVFCKTVVATSGIDSAVRLLSSPIKDTTPTNDRVLKDIVRAWEDNAYKLQVIRVRLGRAWELVGEDYGFQRGDHIDLINHQRKVAIELKNHKDISSITRRRNHGILKRYKQDHPDYRVVFGFINGNGHDRLKDGVEYLYGESVLQLVYGPSYPRLIRRLRQAVRSHF